MYLGKFLKVIGDTNSSIQYLDNTRFKSANEQWVVVVLCQPIHATVHIRKILGLRPKNIRTKGIKEKSPQSIIAYKSDI